MEGIGGLQKIWASGNVSKTTVRRAIKELQESTKNTDELRSWVSENIGAIARGRTAPKPGETRTYKAQQIKNGGPFLRLPLDSLEINKGGSVRVSFEDGQITVRR
jgi:hypothetical protein